MHRDQAQTMIIADQIDYFFVDATAKLLVEKVAELRPLNRHAYRFFAENRRFGLISPDIRRKQRFERCDRGYEVVDLREKSQVIAIISCKGTLTIFTIIENDNVVLFKFAGGKTTR